MSDLQGQPIALNVRLKPSKSSAHPRTQKPKLKGCVGERSTSEFRIETCGHT